MDATTLIWALVLIAVGLAVGFLLGRSQARSQAGEQRTELARAKAERDASAAQLQAITSDRTSMAHEFQRLSAATAERQAVSVDRTAKARLDQTRSLLEPISTSLQAMNDRLLQVERDRAQGAADLRRQVETVASSSESLRKETAALVTALRQPQVRGAWGETQLRRVVEIAGLVERCDFDTQVAVATDDGGLRPDMRVAMADGRAIFVDAKTPLGNFIDAFATDDPDQRTALLDQYVKNVVTHINQLGAKNYWRLDAGSPEMVILFLPSDALLQVALDGRPDLHEYAAAHSVFLASPSILIPMLRERIYSPGFEGVLDYVMRKHDETESDWSRERYQAYMREIPCPVCDGARLKPEVLAVQVGGLSIAQLCELPISEARDFLSDLDLTGQAAQIAGSVLTEINARLGFLVDVGLDYLSLARGAATLSGGEAQRIRLATQIGSGLVGVLYVLDEPSIGLHQRDNTRLIETLQRLRDLGNTLIVVEHDEDTIRSADWIVDIGPGAGELGGEVVYSGDVEGLAGAEGSVTGDYLAGRRRIEIPAERRKRDKNREVTVVGARENNLKDVTVSFPLGVLTAVTGVSGSGKSSLVNSILYQVLANRLNRARGVPGRHKTVRGVEHLDKVVHVDQSPIGRTPRSNPATYTGVWDHIRKIFAAVPESKVRGYGPGRFSFNVKGGRCESCRGDGTLKIEMNFLPDVYVPCEVCHGARYNRETLEIRYKDKTVADVLDMTIHQAADFFSASSVISRHLNTLVEVGLGYVRLGQSATTLSGGEAQRVKLATELQRRSTGRTIYVLDEPTTGLHFEDIRKLLGVLQGLVDKGNSVVVIEHNLDVIANSDWVIDMGPEGGKGGGTVVVAGTPEKVAATESSYTGRFLAPMLEAARG